jgi:hypothetical protein
MLELSRWQETTNQYSIRETLDDHRREHWQQGKQDAALADEIRHQDVGRAELLDLRAEEEYALARSFYGLTYFLQEPEEKLTVDQSLIKTVSQDLERNGFGRVGVEAAPASSEAGDKGAKARPAAGPGMPIWEGLDEEIQHGHRTVPALAAGVVLFVLSLVCFTLADLFSDRRMLTNATAALAIILTAVGITYVVMIDWTIWSLMVAVLLAFLVIAGGFWWFGFRRFIRSGEEALHPQHELDIRAYFGAHLFLRPAHAAFEKFVIVLISVTVLLTALGGALYSHADTRTNDFAHRAFDFEVAMNENGAERGAIAAAGGLAGAGDVFRNRVRCSYSSQQATFGSLAAGRDAGMATKEMSRVCSELKNDRDDIGGVLDRYNFDSDRDPAGHLFNDVYYHRLASDAAEQPNPARLYALSDGYYELSAAWDRKAAVYLADLTLLAIALYLFGQSLSMDAAKIMVGTGIVLASLAVVAGVWNFSTPLAAADPMPAACRLPDTIANSRSRSPEETRIEIASYYYGLARPIGEVARELEDYQEAIKDYDCAVAARKSFIDANLRRANVSADMSSLQRDENYSDLPTRTKIREIVEARQAALDGFKKAELVPTAGPYNSFAFDNFLHAVVDGDQPALEKTIAVLCTQIKLERLAVPCDLHAPPSPRGVMERLMSLFSAVDDAQEERPIDTIKMDRLLYLNVGVALLADQQRERADMAYRMALDQVKAGEDPDLIVSAMTDLNILASYCGKLPPRDGKDRCVSLKPAIAEIKGKLVAGRWATTVDQARLKTPRRISIWAAPARVGWHIDNIDPTREQLSIVWYGQLEPEGTADKWGVWQAIPPLFQKVDFSKVKRNADGSYEDDVLYTGSPNNCLRPGKYVAEFYLNGALIESPVAQVVVPEFETYFSRELNLSLCMTTAAAILSAPSSPTRASWLPCSSPSSPRAERTSRPPRTMRCCARSSSSKNIPRPTRGSRRCRPPRRNFKAAINRRPTRLCCTRSGSRPKDSSMSAWSSAISRATDKPVRC